MKLNPRALLRSVLLTLVVVGCNGPDRSEVVPPAAVGAGATVRYPARTDLMAVKLDGAPTRWNSAGYPPLRSLRLFPNTPDRDLAADLRKQPKNAVLDPTAFTKTYPPAHADRIARLTEAHFGTPFTPGVRLPAAGPDGRALATLLPRGAWLPDLEVATAVAAELGLDEPTLARGAVVYRRWCMQCHGPSGAGEPAQAAEGGPPPRDFRQGQFKYVTAFPPATAPKKYGLGAGGKPRRDDLKRTVRRGIDGTIMPAFPSLTEQELDDVASYVVHLSVRGETEFQTIRRMMSNPEEDEDFLEYTPAVVDWVFAQYLLAVLHNWGVAAKNPVPVPPPFPPGVEPTEAERLKSAVRGYKLYQGEFGCVGCHANYGRSPALKWDAWGSVVQPRNLMLGVYRGGNRGEDLYARVYAGIAPSGMNAFQDKVAKRAPGEQDKIWDVVHFLQALPDPNLRKRMEALDSEVKFGP